MHNPSKPNEEERFEQLMVDGEAEIEKRCGKDSDLKDAAIRLWRKDAGRTTPGMAIYSAERMFEMHRHRENSRQKKR